MSKVIDFLEKVGKSPEFQSSLKSISALVENAELDEEIKEAILARDDKKLEMLLDPRTTIRCLLFPAENEETESDDGKSDDKRRDDRDDGAETMTEKRTLRNVVG